MDNWTYFPRWKNRIIMDRWQCKPVVSKKNKNWLSYFNSFCSLTNSPPFYYRNYFCAQSFVIHWTNISDLSSRCSWYSTKKILFMVNVNYWHYWHYSSLIQTNKNFNVFFLKENNFNVNQLIKYNTKISNQYCYLNSPIIPFGKKSTPIIILYIKNF